MLVYLSAIESGEDRSKFEILYMHYRGLMYHIAYGILNNEQDAEDAVHNAFLKIAEFIGRVKAPISKKTQNYVATIVENKAIDLYRENQRKSKNVDMEEANGILAESNEHGDLENCILSLPPQYRQVIFLKYYQGFSIKEIGKLLDISEANAGKRLQRAKEKLEMLCKGEGIL